MFAGLFGARFLTLGAQENFLILFLFFIVIIQQLVSFYLLLDADFDFRWETILDMIRLRTAFGLAQQ